MDIQILLFLQNFRNGAGSFLTTPTVLFTDIAAYGSAICTIVIYWAVSRSLGYWLMANVVSGFFINNVLKLTACIYRPWIRSPQIIPPEKALKSATGYSFPSGHTQIAASFFGSLAVRIDEDRRPLRAVCVVFILLTGFSRCFLGVHTPQDVLVSIAVAAVLIRALGLLFRKISENPSLLYYSVAVGIIIAVAAILFFYIKAYPMDYLDGDLIVDPEEMTMDGYAAAGVMLGVLAGAAVEVRFIRFGTECTILCRVLRVLTGIPVPLIFIKVIKPLVYDVIGEGAGHVLVYGLLLFYIVALHPALFTAVEKRTGASDPKNTEKSEGT